jgi:soluble lytic murein transglycosylase-like protein
VVAAPSQRRAAGVLILLGALLVLVAGLWVGWSALRSSTLGPRLGGPVVVPEQFRAIIAKEAARCPRVPASILAAQLAAESGWDTQAVSPDGARGIAQFMPRVWRQYGVDGNGDGKKNVWDPEDAIAAAAELNCRNLDLVAHAPGDPLRNALAAYNAGYANVLKYDGVPPFPETQAYVERILESAKTVQM